MAQPIESTPTLYGRDAERFYKELERPKSREEIKKRKKQLEEAAKAYERLRKGR